MFVIKQWLGRAELRMRRTIPVEVPWTSHLTPSADSDGQSTSDVNKMSPKRVKFKRKSNHKKKNKSRIASTNDDQPAKEEIKVQDESLVLNSSTSVNKKKKSAKQARIAFLPEKYQPLVEDDIVDQPRDDNIKKIQDKYKS